MQLIVGRKTRKKVVWAKMNFNINIYRKMFSVYRCYNGDTMTLCLVCKQSLSQPITNLRSLFQPIRGWENMEKLIPGGDNNGNKPSLVTF